MKYRDRARELLNGRMVCFSNCEGQSARENREGFRRLVRLAAEFGGTHVAVGEIPFRYGSWVLPDNTDPYASWCNHAAGLFRVCPPPELRKWVSRDHAVKLQAYIRWQLDVMKPYGLKGTCYAVEPMWLPEGVYREHPRWRGAQCELGRIARRPYFAPCIDDEEVLDLYRRAMREFCTMFPEVDHYSFMTNDSGGGAEWTPNVYPGMNGQLRTRGRDGGARLANWLKAMREGAQQAGVDMRLNLHSSGFPPELNTSAQLQCVPGTFVQWRNNRGEILNGPCAVLGGGLWSVPYPAVGMGCIPDFVAGLQCIYNKPKKPEGLARIAFLDDDAEIVRTVIETVLEDPGQGSEAHARLVLKCAGKFCGSKDGAQTLVGAWRAVDCATHAVRQVRQKGFGQVLAFCGVSMRWLTRPLVPEPEKLSARELKYAAPFLFSADPERDLKSFGYVLGKGVFRGESVVWMARWCLQEAYDTLKSAESAVRSLALGKERSPEARKRLDLYASRIGVYACLVANARNVIMYQYALDPRDQPQYAPNPMDYDDNIIYDYRGLIFRKLARAELDNMTDLIGYLESAGGKVIEHARRKSEESVFMLDADLVAALRHKCAVMLDHWQDYERLYPATKVWDFEPPHAGNILPDEKEKRALDTPG